MFYQEKFSGNCSMAAAGVTGATIDIIRIIVFYVTDLIVLHVKHKPDLSRTLWFSAK